MRSSAVAESLRFYVRFVESTTLDLSATSYDVVRHTLSVFITFCAQRSDILHVGF